MTFQDKILDEYQLKFGDEWKKRYNIDMHFGKVPFCSEDEFLSMLTHVQQERGYQPGWDRASLQTGLSDQAGRMMESLHEFDAWMEPSRT